jgi:hypothetical protein
MFYRVAAVAFLFGLTSQARAACQWQLYSDGYYRQYCNNTWYISINNAVYVQCGTQFCPVAGPQPLQAGSVQPSPSDDIDAQLAAAGGWSNAGDPEACLAWLRDGHQGIRPFGCWNS